MSKLSSLSKSKEHWRAHLITGYLRPSTLLGLRHEVRRAKDTGHVRLCNHLRAIFAASWLMDIAPHAPLFSSVLGGGQSSTVRTYPAGGESKPRLDYCEKQNAR